MLAKNAFIRNLPNYKRFYELRRHFCAIASVLEKPNIGNSAEIKVRSFKIYLLLLYFLYVSK